MPTGLLVAAYFVVGAVCAFAWLVYCDREEMPEADRNLWIVGLLAWPFALLCVAAVAGFFVGRRCLDRLVKRANHRYWAAKDSARRLD